MPQIPSNKLSKNARKKLARQKAQEQQKEQNQLNQLVEKICPKGTIIEKGKIALDLRLKKAKSCSEISKYIEEIKTLGTVMSIHYNELFDALEEKYYDDLSSMGIVKKHDDSDYKKDLSEAFLNKLKNADNICRFLKNCNFATIFCIIAHNSSEFESILIQDNKSNGFKIQSTGIPDASIFTKITFLRYDALLKVTLNEIQTLYDNSSNSLFRILKSAPPEEACYQKIENDEDIIPYKGHISKKPYIEAAGEVSNLEIDPVQ